MAEIESQIETPTQSERLAALETGYAHVATKEDIANVRVSIAHLRTELKADNAAAI